jgi:BASS family bile acid:Na+ symporter
MRIYTPFLATVAVVMIVGSMISSNVAVVSQSGFTIITAVLTLHSCGFAIGFFLSKALGLSDKIARTNSIEVSAEVYRYLLR